MFDSNKRFQFTSIFLFILFTTTLPISLIYGQKNQHQNKFDGAFWGKLQAVKKKQAPQGSTHFIEIGAATYFVKTTVAAEDLKRLTGKFIEAWGKVETNKNVPSIVILDDSKKIKLQKPSTMVGKIEQTNDKKIAKAYPYRLVSASFTPLVSKRDARKFKALLGRNAEAIAFLVTDGRHIELANPKSVKFKLAPGDRLPKNGKDAIAGKWTGTVTLERLPAQAPNIKKGDKLPITFTSTAKNKKATGRLMNAYDIVAVETKKLSKKGKLKTIISYTFEGGSEYPVKFDGKFSKDWKTYAGTWSSSFLGAGTFDMKWSAK